MTSGQYVLRPVRLAKAKLDGPLLPRKLCSTVRVMTDAREWFSAMTDRRVTATEIARYLGVSRNTAQSRLDAGLGADDIIAVARVLHVSPAMTLVELGKLEHVEVASYLESGGTLVETASEALLALELAERLNPMADVEERLGGVDKVRALRASDQDRSLDHRVPDLTDLRGAATRREKDVYPEAPDEGV